MIRNNNIGLITKDESFKSTITKQEADNFFGLTSQQPAVNKSEENEKKNNEDDIFDDIE